MLDAVKDDPEQLARRKQFLEALDQGDPQAQRALAADAAAAARREPPGVPAVPGGRDGLRCSAAR